MSDKRGLILNWGNRIEPAEYNLQEMHERGMSHIHSCVLLTRNNVRKGVEVLLQQRGLRKVQYPGHWCFSAAGHCTEDDFFESVKNSEPADLVGLRRETHEELGIMMQRQPSLALPKIVDPSGKLVQPDMGRLFRLMMGPQTFKHGGEQPFNEHPILTVGWFHMFNGIDVAADNGECEKVEWVSVDQLRERNLTPWLDYFLKTMPNVTSGKTGRQHYYGQIEQQAGSPQITLGTTI